MRMHLALQALSEPNRLAILSMLADGERPAGDLVAAFPALTQPAISRHLRVLREAGLVKVRAQAQRRISTLHAERLSEVDSWLERSRHHWARHLDAVEAHLARHHTEKKE